MTRAELDAICRAQWDTRATESLTVQVDEDDIPALMKDGPWCYGWKDSPSPGKVDHLLNVVNGDDMPVEYDGQGRAFITIAPHPFPGLCRDCLAAFISGRCSHDR